MSRNTRILLVLAIVLVASAFWVGRASAPLHDEKSGPVQGASETKSEHSTSSAAHNVEVAEAPQQAKQSVETPPLPPFGTPVTTMYDELAARARAGDIQAACRLGTELVRCRSQRRLGAVSGLLKKAMEVDAAQASDTSIDTFVTLQDTASAAGALCEGITDLQMAKAIEFQRMAAERGSARMRLWYAAYPALDREFFLRDFDEWQRYREVALPYMQQALEAGVPEAPNILAQVYMPSNGMFSPTETPLRIPDTHLYLVYHELASMLSPSEANEAQPLPQGSVDLTPKPGPEVDMTQVRAEAEQLRQKWYSGYASAEAEPVQVFASSDPQSICGQ